MPSIDTQESLLDEYEYHARVIKAAENWSPIYRKARSAHDQLIKAEAKMERILKKHFRDVADQAEDFIDWRYYQAVKASYDVKVLVKDSAVDQADDILFELLFDTVSIATAAGAQAGEHIYGLKLGLDSASAVIQRIALEQVATLVGKKVLFDGQVVTNEKPEYRISEKTRKDIRQSINVSITLGEDQKAAVGRLRKVINNPKRAEMIARTESVNSYGRGLLNFGEQSGAIGKEWQTVGAIDICSEYAALGPRPFNYVYDKRTGRTGPAAHPNCRCGLRLIYQNELTENPELFNTDTG